MIFSVAQKFGFMFTFSFSALILIFLFSCDPKPPYNSRVAQAQRGEVHFQKYCASCHGENGKGLKMEGMSTKPADLTDILSSRKLTEFPVLEIAQIIDGRNMAKEHGTRPMPVWGEVFSTQEHLDEKEIKGKMGELIAYLMHIQE